MDDVSELLRALRKRGWSVEKGKKHWICPPPGSARRYEIFGSLTLDSSSEVGEEDGMQFLIGLETAPLGTIAPAEMAPAAEALLDELTATGWAQDVVTSFDESDRTLGARFFIEADNIASVACSSEFVFGFLRCVVGALIETLGGTERLTRGTVVGTGGEMHIEPAPEMLAKIEVEAAPTAA